LLSYPNNQNESSNSAIKTRWFFFKT